MGITSINMMKNIGKYYKVLLLYVALYSCAGRDNKVAESAVKENLKLQQELLKMEYGYSHLTLQAEDKKQAAEIQQQFLEMSEAEIKGLDYELAQKSLIHRLDSMYVKKYRGADYSDTLFPAPDKVSFADRILRLHLFFERALPLLSFNGCYLIPKADIKKRLVKIGRYKDQDKYALVYYEPFPLPTARVYFDAGTVYECMTDSGRNGLVTFRIPKTKYLSHISWVEGKNPDTERSFEWPAPDDTKYWLLPAE